MKRKPLHLSGGFMEGNRHAFKEDNLSPSNPKLKFFNN
jgi:hypothetical protein